MPPVGLKGPAPPWSWVLWIWGVRCHRPGFVAVCQDCSVCASGIAGASHTSCACEALWGRGCCPPFTGEKVELREFKK